MIISLRKNASQKSILSAMRRIKEAWEKDAENAPVVDVDYNVYDLPEPYFLEIGGVIRWGYCAGFSAWGFGKSHVLREISAQEEWFDRNR